MSATLVRDDVRVVDFKPVRREIEEKLRQLQAARQTEEVQRAISALTGVLQIFCDDKTGLCGPTMVFPLD